MHLPSHIANLNLLAATPAASPFPYPSSSANSPAQDGSLEDSLKQHLDLWINTEFSWDGSNELSGKEAGKDEDEMNLMDYYKSRVKGRNVLMDNAETPKDSGVKPAGDGLAGFLQTYSSLLSSIPQESLGDVLTEKRSTVEDLNGINSARAPPPTPATNTAQAAAQQEPNQDVMALLNSTFPQYPFDFSSSFSPMRPAHHAQYLSFPPIDYAHLFSHSNPSSDYSVGEPNEKKRKHSSEDSFDSRFPPLQREKVSNDDPLPDGVTPEEDKRRRNTAASARFRMKKKEREQALEKHSRALEERLDKMERDMDSLRKENGWLKALLINGAPQPFSSPPGSLGPLSD